MPLLLKILGVKAIGTLIGTIILLTRPAPGFTTLNIVLEDDSVVVETVLKKGFSEGLDEIIMSGSEVAVFYTVRLFEKDADGNTKTIAKKMIYQSITFSLAESEFRVIVNSDSTVVLSDVEEAKSLISSVWMKSAPVSVIKDEYRYSLKIDAALNTIEIEAIDAKEFDLNAFWNFRYPSRTLDWIEGKELLER